MTVLSHPQILWVRTLDRTYWGYLVCSLSWGCFKSWWWLRWVGPGIIWRLLHSGSAIWACLGLSTAAPTCGLSQWLGLPSNMAASGWSDFFHGGSWLQERMGAAKWRLHGFSWPNLGSHIASLLSYFISWGNHEPTQIQGEGAQPPPLDGRRVRKSAAMF